MGNELGNRIRKARHEAGYSSPEKFAVKLGVSVSTLSRWERGIGDPSVVKLARIAALTDKPLEFFLGEVAA